MTVDKRFSQLDAVYYTYNIRTQYGDTQKMAQRKTRLNLSIDSDLVEFAREHASYNRVTLTDLVTQYFLRLKRREDAKITEKALSDPVFRAEIEESRQSVKDGTAKWYSFDEVFGDGDDI